jgi:hypothetical protein
MRLKSSRSRSSKRKNRNACRKETGGPPITSTRTKHNGMNRMMAFGTLLGDCESGREQLVGLKIWKLNP